MYFCFNTRCWLICLTWYWCININWFVACTPNALLDADNDIEAVANDKSMSVLVYNVDLLKFNVYAVLTSTQLAWEIDWIVIVVENMFIIVNPCLLTLARYYTFLVVTLLLRLLLHVLIGHKQYVNRINITQVASVSWTYVELTGII